jgi:hypothetical protein
MAMLPQCADADANQRDDVDLDSFFDGDGGRARQEQMAERLMAVFKEKRFNPAKGEEMVVVGDLHLRKETEAILAKEFLKASPFLLSEQDFPLGESPPLIPERG